MGIVYLILWPDESMYVGSTKKSLTQRMSCHRYDSKKKDWPLYQKAKEFGWDSCEVIILDEADNYKELESYYIREYNDLLLNLQNPWVSTEERATKKELYCLVWRQINKQHYASTDRVRQQRYRQKIGIERYREMCRIRSANYRQRKKQQENSS
jgi:hypothetical protein